MEYSLRQDSYTPCILPITFVIPFDAINLRLRETNVDEQDSDGYVPNYLINFVTRGNLAGTALCWLVFVGQLTHTIRNIQDVSSPAFYPKCDLSWLPTAAIHYM